MMSIDTKNFKMLYIVKLYIEFICVIFQNKERCILQQENDVIVQRVNCNL